MKAVIKKYLDELDEGLFITNSSLNALVEILIKKNLISQKEFDEKVREIEDESIIDDEDDDFEDDEDEDDNNEEYEKVEEDTKSVKNDKNKKDQIKDKKTSKSDKKATSSINSKTKK